MSIIEVSHLTKTYHESDVPVQALKSVSFSVESGEFTAIVGPSGSGKSTLLNLLGGLDAPTEGEVVIDGVNLGNLKPFQQIEFRLNQVGFVFQSYNLIPVLTAQENIEFIMELQNRPRKEQKDRAESLLEMVGLKNRAHHRPAQLSGGEQQRIAVARALASKPKFILADEPTANLDSHSAESLLDIMAELNQTTHTTFLFSTHDARVIQRAHRVLTLQDGEITSDVCR